MPGAGARPSDHDTEAVIATDCRCPQCWGLAEFMLQLTGKDYGLPAASGHVALLPDPCDGSYVCECSKCRAEVRALVERRAA